jgi:hypothetical protein
MIGIGTDMWRAIRTLMLGGVFAAGLAATAAAPAGIGLQGVSGERP